MHRLAKLPGWKIAKFPVLNPDGTSAWPARWPIERIEARRLELGPVRFMATMMCEATSEAALCFRQEDIDRALSNGAATEFSDIPSGRVVIACDPAWTSRPRADESGIVMVLIDDTGFRHLTLVEGWRIPHPPVRPVSCPTTAPLTMPRSPRTRSAPPGIGNETSRTARRMRVGSVSLGSPIPR